MKARQILYFFRAADRNKAVIKRNGARRPLISQSPAEHLTSCSKVMMPDLLLTRFLLRRIVSSCSANV